MLRSSLKICNTVFNDSIKVESTLEGYELTADFKVNNAAIQKMLEEGILKYAISITCKSTLMREMQYIDPKDPILKIPAGDVHFQVNYVPYIVAAEDIPVYFDDDFSDDYKGIDYSISRGSILGIGTPRFFKALYERDQISDVSSIIAVSGSDTEKYMKIDLEASQIRVVLPQEQCTSYKNCNGRKNKYPLLHSVVIIPALMEAIIAAHAAADGDETSQRPWCIILQQQIKNLSVLLHESEDFLYENPLRTAQIIMGNNSGVALKTIEEME